MDGEGNVGQLINKLTPALKINQSLLYSDTSMESLLLTYCKIILYRYSRMDPKNVLCERPVLTHIRNDVFHLSGFEKYKSGKK